MLINKERPEIASNAHFYYFSVADVVNVLYIIYGTVSELLYVLICKGNEASKAGMTEWPFFLLYKGILTQI